MNFCPTSYWQKNKSVSFNQRMNHRNHGPKNSQGSQMQKLMDKDTIRVVVHEDSAYWVHENAIYKAEISMDGRINVADAFKIDVFSLSNKETEKLLSILDSISEI
jgi:hypothetical protein